MFEDPAGTNQPGAEGTGTNAAPAQEFDELRISDKTAYRIPKGSVVPEPVLKGLREKESYIGRLEEKIKGFESQSQVINQIQQAFVPQTKAEELPDPVENPQGFQDAVIRRAEQRAELRTAQRHKAFSETAVEIETLRNLVNSLVPELSEEQKNDATAVANREATIREHYIKALDHARNLGLLVETDFLTEDGKKMPHFKSNAARAVFRDLYYDQIVAGAKGAGLKNAQDIITNAQAAPSGVSGQGIPQGRRDYGQMTDAERAAERQRVNELELREDIGIGRKGRR